jgi:two-component system alkaline phosphatase synthesis response regulator PhoP
VDSNLAKVLIVDDEEDIRNLGKIMLSDIGHDVLTAGNAGDALTIAEEEKPDLILMDIVMPGRNGFDVCKILKFKPATKDIPVIMFSALGRDIDKKMAEEAGAEAYITKPFNKEQLIEIVEKLTQ